MNARSVRGEMIARVWQGRTTPENADAYEALLRGTVFPRIAALGVPGHRATTLLRRRVPDGEEFMTILWFDSIEAVKRFAGEDYEAAYVPAEARSLLAQFDQRSRHFEVRQELTY